MRGGWRMLAGNVRPARADAVTLLLGSIVANAPAFASGLLIANALDRGFLANRPAVGLLALATLAVLGVLGAFAAQALLPVMERVVEPFRDRLAAAVVGAELSRLVADDAARDDSGAAAIRATEHVESARSLVIALLRSAFGMTVSIVVALAGLATLMPQVALAVLPFLALAFAGYLLVLRFMLRRQRAVLLAEEQVGQSTRAVLYAQRDVEACGAQDWAQQHALTNVDAAAAAARHVTRIAWWRSLVPAIAIQLPIVLLLGLSPWLIDSAGISAGDLVGGVVYLVRGLAPAVGFLISGGAGWFVQLGLVAERLAATTDTATTDASRTDTTRTDTTRTDTATTEAARTEGATAAMTVPATTDAAAASAAGFFGPLDLRMSGVTFAYSAHAAPVLYGADLSVPYGAHVAVVGPSGAGKSTLAAILTGLRSPQRGQVRLGSEVINAWQPEVLRRNIAFVPQESYVFAGTVTENLAYLCSDVDDSALNAAVLRFGLAHAIERLGGLDATIPAGGGSLSAGERQQIALARAWLSAAPITVLDEATCHLDPQAEQRAEAAMRERAGTLVVVAHRISSAMRADLVVIVEDGSVVTDTHERLVAKNPRYAELVSYWSASSSVA